MAGVSSRKCASVTLANTARFSLWRMGRLRETRGRPLKAALAIAQVAKTSISLCEIVDPGSARLGTRRLT
jgi:hypothetical protein